MVCVRPCVWKFMSKKLTWPIGVNLPRSWAATWRRLELGVLRRSLFELSWDCCENVWHFNSSMSVYWARVYRRLWELYFPFTACKESWLWKPAIFVQLPYCAVQSDTNASRRSGHVIKVISTTFWPSTFYAVFHWPKSDLLLRTLLYDISLGSIAFNTPLPPAAVPRWPETLDSEYCHSGCE